MFTEVGWGGIPHSPLSGLQIRFSPGWPYLFEWSPSGPLSVAKWFPKWKKNTKMVWNISILGGRKKSGKNSQQPELPRPKWYYTSKRSYLHTFGCTLKHAANFCLRKNVPLACCEKMKYTHCVSSLNLALENVPESSHLDCLKFLSRCLEIWKFYTASPAQDCLQES